MKRSWSIFIKWRVLQTFVSNKDDWSFLILELKIGFNLLQWLNWFELCCRGNKANFRIVERRNPSHYVTQIEVRREWSAMYGSWTENCSNIEKRIRIHLRTIIRFYGAFLFCKRTNVVFKILIDWRFWMDAYFWNRFYLIYSTTTKNVTKNVQWTNILFRNMLRKQKYVYILLVLAIGWSSIVGRIYTFVGRIYAFVGRMHTFVGRMFIDCRSDLHFCRSDGHRL